MPGIWHHGCCCVNDSTITECPEDCSGCASELTIGHTGPFQIIMECWGGGLIDATAIFQARYTDDYVATNSGGSCNWNNESSGSIAPVTFAGCPFPSEGECNLLVFNTNVECDPLSGFPDIRWRVTRSLSFLSDDSGNTSAATLQIVQFVPALLNCPAIGEYETLLVANGSISGDVVGLPGSLRPDLSSFGNLTVSA